MEGFNTLNPRQKNITISSRLTTRLPLSKSRIESFIRKTFKLLKAPSKVRPIGVIFLNDKDISRLNRKYLKQDGPTDVLAFDYGSSGFELAISLDTAGRNAKIYNTSLKKEVMLYIIHGILHLCGYNDTTLAAQRKMFKKQEEIAKCLFTRPKR